LRLLLRASERTSTLGLGAGTDFDSRITVKINAPELLAQELARRSWRGETITFSGITDCYQPAEARYQLTRRCLEVCLSRRNPVALITKAALVRRDAELLAALSRGAGCTVYLSIPFADEELGRKIEPGASAPSLRFETLRALSAAGVETGAAVSPVIPGLNDDQLARVLARAAQAGAKRAFMTPVRLPAEVLPVFRERLERAFPARARKVLHAIEEMRGGKLNESAFGARMRGQGERWAALRQLFEIQCRRLGLQCGSASQLGQTSRPPGVEARAKPAQGLLFEDG